MTFVLSAVAFFVLLTLLILIHELGHFMAARKAKVIVEEFGFGLPPKLTTLFTQGRTRFTLNAIPFGGFVRLKGENAMDDKERLARGSFGAASYPARIAILVAGVFMNFVLAIALLTIGFSAGRWIPTFLSYEEMQVAADQGIVHFDLDVRIARVLPDSPAERAGIPEESIVVAVDDNPVRIPGDIKNFQTGKEQVTYTLLVPQGEGTVERTFRVRPSSEGLSGIEMEGEIKELVSPGRSIIQAFGLALRETRVMTVQTVLGIGHLMKSLALQGEVPEGITGIVGIAQLTHASVQQGFMTYLRLVALLSLSLAILNILPFPALDGGRLLFVLAEMIGRRPLNRRFEVTTNALGFVFLVALIVLITFHDIIRLF